MFYDIVYLIRDISTIIAMLSLSYFLINLSKQK